MAPKSSHVMKLVVEAGGLDMTFSPECKKALLACGINPKSFDTYKRRLGAEKEARRELKKQTGSSSSQKALDEGKPKPDLYLEANSQSGHMAQNAFFQGQRDSPCTNVAPSGGDAGGYGYQMGSAPCTDHYGGSTEPGTTHKDITTDEAKRAAELRNAKPPVTRLTQDKLKEYVRETAKTAAEGSKDAKTGGARAKRLAKAQADKAKKGQDPKKAGKPAKPKPVEKAADCMVAAWEKAIDQQRENCIANYSTEARIDREYPGLDKKERAKRIKERKEELQRQQDDPEFQDQVKRRAKSLKKADQAQACLEYQANWLQDHRGEDGNLPPIAGRIPGTADSDGGSGGNKGGKRF